MDESLCRNRDRLGQVHPGAEQFARCERRRRKALPPGLAAQIVAKADGVPLFVEELTKTIMESGDLILEGDRYAYAGSSANVTIPETLRELADGAPR